MRASHARHAELRAQGRRVGGRPVPGRLTPGELTELRYQVRCMECGAVPVEYITRGRETKVGTLHQARCAVAELDRYGSVTE